MTPPRPGPPPSWATAGEARAYVAAVLGRAQARGAQPARPAVYLICPPAMSGRRGNLRSLLPALRSLLPGAELLTYADVFAAEGRALQVPERVARLAAEVSGAVVLPRQWRKPGGPERAVIGEAARAEALGLVALGVPVLVFAGAALVAWPDVRLVEAPSGRPPRFPWLVELPAGSGVILPTLAASYRAMGLAEPEARALGA